MRLIWSLDASATQSKSLRNLGLAWLFLAGGSRLRSQGIDGSAQRCFANPSLPTSAKRDTRRQYSKLFTACNHKPSFFMHSTRLLPKSWPNSTSHPSPPTVGIAELISFERGATFGSQPSRGDRHECSIQLVFAPCRRRRNVPRPHGVRDRWNRPLWPQSIL